MFKILAINPGATSTKIGIYENENPVRVDIIRHEGSELARYQKSVDQYKYRKEIIEDSLKLHNFDLSSFSAVVGRGGTFKPLPGGVYEVNQAMIDDVLEGKVQAEHVSLIGCLLAKQLADQYGIPSFVVDPVSVDEFTDTAKISGLPELPRKSLSHALNIKMVARKYASSQGKKIQEFNLVIAHLGGGISIVPMNRGKIIDANNANDGGPMSPQRSGYLPVTGLIKLCYSEKYSQPEMITKVIKKGGLTAHCGTDDLREIITRIEQGDQKADLIFRAMVYQIAKEIGAMSAVLKGNVDAIIITGGMAHQHQLTDALSEFISWIAPIEVFPGEDELEALVRGTLLVLRKEIEPAVYQ
ncbi:MAG: butyrate kinase [Desulfuromonas sp. SDB]|nr:MAG: butyrate kinase [Desulfuromonas sp. SDB]